VGGLDDTARRRPAPACLAGGQQVPDAVADGDGVAPVRATRGSTARMSGRALDLRFGWMVSTSSEPNPLGDVPRRPSDTDVNPRMVSRGGSLVLGIIDMSPGDLSHRVPSDSSTAQPLMNARPVGSTARRGVAAGSCLEERHTADWAAGTRHGTPRSSSTSVITHSHDGRAAVRRAWAVTCVQDIVTTSPLLLQRVSEERAP
jgi:hypothetical protein